MLHLLVDTVVDEYGQAYPELTAARQRITQKVLDEERRFDSVIASGLPRLDEVLSRAAAQGGEVSGDDAFKLYDTYGLPRDFIEDMIESRRLKLDSEGFQRAMERQREKARAGSTFKSQAVETMTLSDGVRAVLDSARDQAFRGYDSTTLNTQALVLFDAERREAASLDTGQEGLVVLAETPFYLEAGGQVSDVGTLSGPWGEGEVTGVVKVGAWPRLHAVRITRGTLKPRDLLTASVTADVRDATRRNHTATHLLHAALRAVLGAHVKQAGSLVAPDRLRFDFVHFNPVTHEQQLDIERIVNEHVLKNTPVQTEVKDTQEAIAAGAMALFGEKYGDKVRVVSIPGFSQELCGGTHVRATGDIGLFLITLESGVSAGTRRIEAVTGLDAWRYSRERADIIHELTNDFHSPLKDLTKAINVHMSLGQKARKEVQDLKIELAEAKHTQAENERLRREIHDLRLRLPEPGHVGFRGLAPDVQIVQPIVVPEDGEDLGHGHKLIRLQMPNVGKEGLRTLVDRYRDKVKSGVVVLAVPSDEKFVFAVGVTADLSQKVSAGRVAKALAESFGGRGGGRPDFAEAGGKDASKIPEMLAESRRVVEKLLSA